eukprot:1142018-Pelagomonas_calceolata.AAC.1
MLAGEDQSQADQPNSLAEGPPVIEPRRSQGERQYMLYKLLQHGDQIKSKPSNEEVSMEGMYYSCTK